MIADIGRGKLKEGCVLSFCRTVFCEHKEFLTTGAISSGYRSIVYRTLWSSKHVCGFIHIEY